MKKNKKSSIRRSLNRFYCDQSGVYSVMTALFSFALIGYVAFVVDGTGMLLDKARLNQGVEQAGLFLTATTGNERNLISMDGKVRTQNKEMIGTIVGTYYKPNMIGMKVKSSQFDYSCSLPKGTQGIACQVGGYFDRPTWLYLGKGYKNDYGTTFNREERVASDSIQFKRATHPMDVMFVVSFSASMSEPIWTGSMFQVKGYMVKQALKDVMRDLLKKDGSNHNRVGMMGYSWGVALSPDSGGMGGGQKCYLPYAMKNTEFGLLNEQTKAEERIKINGYDNLEKYIKAVVNNSLNSKGIPEATRELEKTLERFSKSYLDFDSVPRRTTENNATKRKEKYCLAWGGNYGSSWDHHNIQSLSYWVTKNDSKTPSWVDTFVDKRLQTDSKVSHGIPAGGLLNAGRIMAQGLNPAGRATQRKIIIISDGDSFGFTEKLIRHHQLCKRVVDLLNKDQNESNKIYYISLGYYSPKNGKRDDLWHHCTGGRERFAEVHSKRELSEALKKFTKPKSTKWRVVEDYRQ